MKAVRDKKLLFLFPHPALGEIKKIELGQLPTERLYGFIELRKKGWDVDICDERFAGISRKILQFLKQYGFNYINLKTINKFRKYDVIIVKDNFCLIATVAAKLLRKKIIYFDAMFEPPSKIWKRWLTGLNIKLSDAVFAYSSSQISLWAHRFHVSNNHFRLMRYTIDLDFYKPYSSEKADKPFVLSVGRDMGRDFDTLASALEDTGIGLKLVTMPYLVKDFDRKYPWAEIYEKLSYKDLFRLYAQAIAVVVPLKPNLTYPSGIRGVLESMALGKATICTRTPVLEESFKDEKELIYVDAGDSTALRNKIIWLKNNEKQRGMIQQNAQKIICAKFGMQNFVEEFEKVLLIQ